MRSIKSFVHATLLSTVAILAAPAAYAQDAEGDGGLEEIVVTAQKRQTNLQDTPIAITALTSSALSDRAATRIEDIAGAVPNVYIDQRSLRSQAIAIRGLSADLNNPGLDQSVGIYVDGVYLGRATPGKPWVMIASDGAYVDAVSLERGYAHPRASGSFTRVLGHYSRDLGLFPLSEAIRKMTSFPAEHLGLTDRGKIAVGLAADLVLFDPKTVDAKATYVDPAALSVGIQTVFVNGKIAFEQGKPTGEVAGRFVRRQSSGKPD